MFTGWNDLDNCFIYLLMIYLLIYNVILFYSECRFNIFLYGKIIYNTFSQKLDVGD